MPRDVSILGGSREEDVLERVKVGPERELVHERLPDVRRVLEGELVQGPRFLPLLHEPHA